MIAEPSEPQRRTSKALLWLAGAACALMVLLRVVALRSDPYARLDWDTGILTDEGFYLHNARNLVLFGHARLDEFNNMLIAPLVHGAQVVWFALFGVGSEQARLLSVLISLLTLVAFYVTLRRGAGAAVAAIGTLLLGLDHPSLLFSRLALLDVPAALLAVCALYAFVRAGQAESEITQRRKGAKEGRAAVQNSLLTRAWGSHEWWLAACGALIAVTVVNRSLCIYLIPVPYAALWVSGGLRRRDAAALTAGLLAMLLLYGVLWYWPNRAEIAHMNHYYRTAQIQPHTLKRLRDNIVLAFCDDFYGIFSYLFRHTPILFALSLLGVGRWALGVNGGSSRKGAKTQRPDSGSGFCPSSPHPLIPSSVVASLSAFLSVWVLLMWGVLAVSNYSPDRYFVTMYPPLAGLASITLWQWREIWEVLGSRRWQARLVRGLIGGALVYHLALAICHYGGLLPRRVTVAVLWGSFAAGFAAAAVLNRPAAPEGEQLGQQGLAESEDISLVGGSAGIRGQHQSSSSAAGPPDPPITGGTIGHSGASPSAREIGGPPSPPITGGTIGNSGALLANQSDQSDLSERSIQTDSVAAPTCSPRYRGAGGASPDSALTPYTPNPTPSPLAPNARRLTPVFLLLAAWLVVNVWWYASWARQLRYTQYEAGQWITTHLPADAILLGDVAPGVAIDTRFHVANVMKGLCNDRNPVERYRGRPAYALLIDGDWKGPYWVERYPRLVEPRLRIKRLRVIKWWIGVYRVD